MLGARVPPVTALLDAQAPIALASDFNPGTSAVSSMPAVIALGCALYGLTPDQALHAATAVPAAMLGVTDAGTLEPGKRADLVVLEGPSVRMTPYRLGHDPVVAVVLGGEVVHQRSEPANGGGSC
jgi:imidazolonepropionase